MSEAEAAHPAPNKNEPSFIRLAEAHRAEGLVEDAIRICREGLARFPGSAHGRIVLGQCLLDHGAIGEAIVELGRVERESGGDPAILARLCDVRLAGPQRYPMVADRGALPGVTPTTRRSESPELEPIEPPVLTLDSPGETMAGSVLDDSPQPDPLASTTLAGLYRSQGDPGMADTILRQMTAEAVPPAEDVDQPAEEERVTYLAELTRLRQVAERLRKGQAR